METRRRSGDDRAVGDVWSAAVLCGASRACGGLAAHPKNAAEDCGAPKFARYFFAVSGTGNTIGRANITTTDFPTARPVVDPSRTAMPQSE